MLTRRDFLKVSATGGTLVAVGMPGKAWAGVQPMLPKENEIFEKSRQIPVHTDVDIVVVGGSSRAVAAAAAAAANGSRVFLVAGLPYLGDDICGSMLYEQVEGEKLLTDLSERLYPWGAYPTPAHVKKTLQDTLIDNGVDFIHSSYPTNVLKDSSGAVCGVVIVNRSGRQAIRAKAVIDATHDAAVARMAGAKFSDFVPGKREFSFSVVGNSPKSGGSIVRSEPLPIPVDWNGKKYPITRYTIEKEVKDFCYDSLMEAEQKARSLVWDPDQVDSSDLLWYIPSQKVLCEQSFTGDITSLRLFPEKAMKPKDVDGIYVLGPCADMSREDANKLMRPAAALVLGEMLGCRVSNYIANLSEPVGTKVSIFGSNPSNLGYVGEILSPLRHKDNQEWVDCAAGSLPVLGSYDVVILGGGTAGATAGISAAKQGAKTLMLEYLHGLGGIATLGLMGEYYDGFREGYTKIVDAGVRAMAPADHPRQTTEDWHFVTDWKMEYYRKEYLQAGGKLWFGTLGCGAVVENGTVKGVVITTPFGRGVVLSKVLIDSTGSADIAIAAGANFNYSGAKTFAFQGAAAGRNNPLDYYTNNDWLFIDDTDILDVTRAFVAQKEKFHKEYDSIKIPQTRERRRVVGDYFISVYDVLNHRHYPDTISFHRSSFDTHGYITDPYFLLSPPMGRNIQYDADVPLRCLLPKGLEGILTTGLGASAHRDAMPVIRMQPCLQNQGYAVGYLSAMAVREGIALRKVNIKKVQRHLVSIGNLPERVLTDKEFKGFTSKEMKAAAATVGNQYKGLEILLTDTVECKRLMIQKMGESPNAEEKVVYASILCMLGDATYTSVLKEAVAGFKSWDKGWHYTGMAQYGMCVSRLDALIISLGRTRDASALPVILEKAKQLYPEDYFSHFRAISMACEEIGSSEAVATLAYLLRMPGMRHHCVDSLAKARSMIVPSIIDTSFRNKALKEIHLARALYKCGDKDGLGKATLLEYSNCMQGHYSRCASELLELM